ncbi:MAG: TonB-dependent receptor [Chitinophagaceae bacterium]
MFLVQLLVVLILSFKLTAQNETIGGIVKDAGTFQPIPGYSVSIFNSVLGTIGNEKGAFKITIPSDLFPARLIVSSLGYLTDTIQVLAGSNNFRITLIPSRRSLSEVVITGVSKATLIRESPVPVSVVSTRQIEVSSENNIIDVLAKNVPGLNAVKTGPNISKPFIRGLGYNRVLTLYDGIRQEGQQWGDEHGIEVDAYNIERGEVIKGPASLTYGSDAMAGVVSLYPAMPVHTDASVKGKYFSEYQSNNGLIGNGLRLTFANAHWGVALRGSYRLAKNYENNIDGRVYNSGFREANASASVKHIDENGSSVLNFTLYDNLQGIPDGSRDSVTRKFTKQVDEGALDDIYKRPIVSDAEQDSYQLSPLHQHIQHYRIYTNNHYHLGNGDIDFLIAFQQNLRREYNHPTAPQQPGMFVQLNTINYGVSYNLLTDLNLDVTLGINGMQQSNKNKRATDFPIPNYHLFDAGGYLHIKWKQEKWTVSGGFRYDTRLLQGDDFYTGLNNTTGFGKQVFLPDTTGSNLQFPSFKKRFRGTSMILGATYLVNEQISLKVNIARGYRAPSITEFASNGLDPGAHIIYLGNRNFVPEFSLQEDIGAEMRFKNLSASFSVFNNNIQHYIYLAQVTNSNGTSVIDAQGNKTYQYQQSSAQLYGIEATLNLHPSSYKGFSFDNSCSIIYGYNKKTSFIDKGVNGEYLPLIPPVRVLSSINQQIPTKSILVEAIQLKWEADFNAGQNRYLALNDTETATRAFTMFNFSSNTQINFFKNIPLQVQLQVNNVFNKAYQSNLNRLKYFEYYSQSPGGRLGIYNMGRNICFKLIVPF